MARQAQALEDATHGWPPHPHARFRGDAGAQFVLGEVGLVAHLLAKQAMARLVHARSLPAGMGLRGNGPRRPMLAEHFLGQCETYPEQVR